MTGADLVALMKKQPIAFGCGLIAVVAGVLLFVRSDAVKTAQDEFQAKEQEAQKMDVNVRNTAGLSEAVAEMQEAGKQFDTRLVRASQLANNLQIFYRLESETGVKLLDARPLAIPAPRPGERRGAYVPVPFNISINGTYAQVSDFLRRVEASPQFVRVTQLTLNKLATEGASSASDPMSATIQIEALGTP